MWHTEKTSPWLLEVGLWCRCRSLSCNNLQSWFQQLLTVFEGLIYGSTLTFPQSIISASATSGALYSHMKTAETERGVMWTVREIRANCSFRELSRGFCTQREGFRCVPDPYRNLSDDETGVLFSTKLHANISPSRHLTEEINGLVPAQGWRNKSRNPSLEQNHYLTALSNIIIRWRKVKDQTVNQRTSIPPPDWTAPRLTI